MDQKTVLKILRTFKRALESNGIHVDSFILFGSHAAGTAHADSDIDVIVISSSFTNRGFWERINILTEAIYEVFAPIEATAFTPEEWNKKKSLLAGYAKDGVLIS